MIETGSIMASRVPQGGFGSARHEPRIDCDGGAPVHGRRVFIRVVVTLALCAAALTASCSRQPAPAPNASPLQPTGYNLIMISMNNVGAQHMTVYGYKRPTTPHLDAFARDALVFEEVFTPCSWTLPAATSVMTSLQPYSHRVMDRWHGNSLNKGIPVLPEILRNHGYATAAFTGGLDYRPTLGHLRGVTDSSFNLDFTGFDVTLKQAERWLARNGDKKFCLVLQGYDAHAPFQPPAPYKGTFSGGARNVRIATNVALRGYRNGDKYVAHYIWQDSDPRKHKMLAIAYPPEKRTVVLSQDDIDYLRDLYDDTVLSADAQVGAFLARLDPQVLARTVVVVFSEHGEMFGRHGRFGRAGTVRGNLHDDVAHVPLIIRTPSGLKGRIQGLGQLIDVAPTVLALLGLPSPPEFQGRSLLPLAQGSPEVNEYVFAGAEYNMGSRGTPHPFYDHASVNESIRSRKWKLIREKVFKKEQGSVPEEAWELYDMAGDADETVNLVSSSASTVAELAERLHAWSRATHGLMKDRRPTNMDFPPDFVDKARHHGYW